MKGTRSLRTSRKVTQTLTYELKQQLYYDSSADEASVVVEQEDEGDIRFDEDVDDTNYVVDWSQNGKRYTLPRGCGITVDKRLKRNHSVWMTLTPQY